MLNDRERQTFSAIADVLIPSFDGMPSFSQSGAAQAHTDRVLELRPELLDDLKSVLALAAETGDAAETADRLNREQPAAIGLIGLVASSAYYLDDDVRKRLGYPGQLQRPPTAAEEYDYEALLQPVIERGPIYRRTPD